MFSLGRFMNPEPPMAHTLPVTVRSHANWLMPFTPQIILAYGSKGQSSRRPPYQLKAPLHHPMLVGYPPH